MKPHQATFTLCCALVTSLTWLILPDIAHARHDIAHNHVDIVARYPHDSTAFTQGLLYAHGELYESTGLRGHSDIRRVAVDDGRILARRALPSNLFGEGLALAGRQLHQLTWKAGTGLVRDRKSLAVIKRFSYAGQGWGLTWDGYQLIMSNGSAMLQFMSAQTHRIERRLQVTQNGVPVKRLNELEYINGEIWANIRYRDDIVRIDPKNGHVVGVIDAHRLRRQLPDPDAAGVLNGIAWDADGGRLFLTGKHWPILFEVRVPGVLP